MHKLDEKALAANRIWFDTEFIEDGKSIELVSIGLVRADGATYYAEVEGVDYSRADPWLHANVFPHLQGGYCIKSREQIAAEIVTFAGSKPEFWAYYADYDWVALCQLYGRMIDLPKGWPMFCRDLKQVAGETPLPRQVSAEHHALADAVWTMEAHADLAAAPSPAPVAVKGWKRVPVEFLDFVKNAPVSSGVCCCGDNMQTHTSPMSCGHSPVDQWDYSLSRWLNDIDIRSALVDPVADEAVGQQP